MRTSSDQVYFAPVVDFGAGDYVSSAGAFDSASAGTNIINGDVTVDAGTNAEFAGTVNGVTGDETLTVIARGGRAGFFRDIGGTTPFDTLTVTASAEAVFSGINTLGDVTVTAPLVDLIGGQFTIGGALDVTGDVEMLVDTEITANDALTVDGNIDRSSGADFGIDVTLESTTANVLVTGNIGGTLAPDNLVVTAATDIDVGDATTIVDQSFTAPLVTLRGATYDAGGDVTVDGTTRLDGVTTVDAGGSILFTGTIDREAGLGSLVATAGLAGDVTVEGVIGGINRLGSVNLTALGGEVSTVGANTRGDQRYAGASVLLAGAYDADGGDIDVVGPATITGPVSVTAADNVSFSATIDAATGPGHSLVVTAENGGITFTGAIGDTQAPNSVTATAATQISAADITTRDFISLAAPVIDLTGSRYIAGGLLTFAGAVELGNDTLIEADDAVLIDGSINGDGTDLTITSNEAGVEVTGPIGASEAIDVLAVNAATSIAVQDARTNGSQTYTGPAVALNGETYDAGGDFTVSGAATLDGVTTVDADGSILFTRTINAAGAAIARLTATAGSTGDVTVRGVIGGVARLASVSLTAGDQVTVAGANTVGNQRFAGAGVALAGDYDSDTGNVAVVGPATIEGPVTITAGDSASFSSTVDAAAGGGDSLTVTAQAGSVAFAGIVGGTTAIDGLRATAATTLATASITSSDEITLIAEAIELNGSTYTAGTELKLTGAVGITQDTDLTGAGAVIITGSIDRSPAAAGAPNLAITSENSGVVLNAPVGQTRRLGDLTVDGDVNAFLADIAVNGDLIVRAPDIALTGSTYSAGGGLLLSGDTTVAGATSISATDTVTIAGTLDTDDDAAAPADLDISSSDSSVSLLGEVGGNRRLGSLEVDAAGEIGLEAGVHTTGDQRYTAASILMAVGDYDSEAGDIAVEGDLFLVGEVGIDAADDLTITGTIDSGSDGGDGLRGLATFNAGGDITILGEVGQEEPLAGFSLTAGNAIDPPSVTTFGPQFYRAPTILLTGDLYRTNGGSFTTIGALTLSAPSVTLNTNILTSTAGDILLDGPVTGNDVIIDAGEASITGLDVAFTSLTVFHVTGSATMGGTIGGASGSDAARAVLRPDGIADTYLFNGCVMAVGCFSIDDIPRSEIDFHLPDPPLVLVLSAPPLIVAAGDAFIDDPRFVFSNTGKDALWRLDLDESAPAEEEKAQ
ncbi:hypothetical protein D3874_15980 [Oleomonas cavernae]|uniref:Uncharacterized protein n=1 Tax=Oleomonas cavernae TaxID=2320859 RepID=A0A418WE74_9PROT|nr:hypothetical protein [Oleomonas cavernae]RJF88327.1 hypothetical protein D3874_15980 [Oleomonas cavernae]